MRRYNADRCAAAQPPDELSVVHRFPTKGALSHLPIGEKHTDFREERGCFVHSSEHNGRSPIGQWAVVISTRVFWRVIPLNMNELGRQRLQDLVDAKHHGDMKAASKAARLGETYVRDILKRGKNGRSAELVKLARHFNVSVDFVMGVEDAASTSKRSEALAESPSHILIVGKVGAGIWYEVFSAPGIEGYPISVFPPDPHYPITVQFDLEVVGTSLEHVARDGELLRCVKFDAGLIEPQNGDIVVVERSQRDGALIETTVKRYHRVHGRIELRPASDDPRWQTPIVIPAEVDSGDDQVRITGIVLYAYRSVFRGR